MKLKRSNHIWLGKINMFSIVFRLYMRFFWSYEKQARYNGVFIGENCDIQDVSFGSEPYLITIGNNVQITNGTKIFTHGGAHVLRGKHPEIDFFGKVKIGNNVYIGNSTLILPGVTIGSNVIIGAGSVVSKSVPDNVVVAGNPAKIICSLDDFENKMIKLDVKSKFMNSEEKKKYLLSLSEERFFIKK